MTHEMAKTLVRQIQNFCNKKTSCGRCPFEIKINISETGCKIGFPCDWSLWDNHIIGRSKKNENVK